MLDNMQKQLDLNIKEVLIDSDLGFQLDFDWEGETYTTESDVIFVVKS
jgi:hypothetical protein